MTVVKKRHPAYTWTDLGTIKFYLTLIANNEVNYKGFVKPRGAFPTERLLDTIGYRGLRTAVYTYHKTTLRRLASELGFNIHKKPDGYWQSWPNVLNAMLKEIDREYVVDGKVIKPRGVVPTREHLRQVVLNGLGKGAGRHHGGYDIVKRKAERFRNLILSSCESGESLEPTSVRETNPELLHDLEEAYIQNVATVLGEYGVYKHVTRKSLLNATEWEKALLNHVGWELIAQENMVILRKRRDTS